MPGKPSRQGAQQNDSGAPASKVPLGWPPWGGQVPGFNVAFFAIAPHAADCTVTWTALADEQPVTSVDVAPVQSGLLFTVTVAPEQPAPAGAPHVHGVQPR